MFGIRNKNFKMVSMNLTCSLVIIDGILRDFALSTFRITNCKFFSEMEPYS